jgi:hypothetical protein
MEFVFRQGEQTLAFTAWNYHDLTLPFSPHNSSQIFFQHSSFCSQPATLTLILSAKRQKSQRCASLRDGSPPPFIGSVACGPIANGEKTTKKSSLAAIRPPHLAL